MHLAVVEALASELLEHQADIAGGNKAEAARLLGIGRSTLYRQLAALRIDLGRQRP